MLSIDEVIARERQMAETHRNDIVPKENYHNMPWIDKNNETSMRNAEEHEQIAEWLEELKAIKDGSIPIIHGKAELELHDKVIRNEAIDEFARKLHKGCIEMIKQTWGSNIAPLSWAEAYANFKVDIDEIAEQMKEMYFEFGALSDKFSEQCERQGYRLKNAEKWDKLVHCTVMLYIHNILTESRYNECLYRILKFYKDDLEEI